jgi:hypothetical protein
MKKFFFLLALLSSLASYGCVARITGPGPGSVDVSRMREVDQACAVFVLGFGPFGDALLTKQVDTIQYSIHNYIFFGKVCATGYEK